jgi:RNA polymerase sigma-32 factor
MQNPDSSLNRPVGDDVQGEEVIDKIASNQANSEQIAIFSQEKNRREEILKSAFEKLNEREKEIIKMRQLTEPASTLEELSKVYQISKERVRQIEAAALEKIKKEVRRLA